MAPRRKKRLGIGAKCSVLYKYLHPTDIIKATVPNYGDKDRLDDLVAVKQDFVTRDGRTFKAVFFASATFPDETGLYASVKYLKLKQEGHPDGFFDADDAPSAPAAAAVAATEEPDEEEEIDQSVFFAANTTEDIALVQNQGLNVDDDNAPAPENIPTANAPAQANDGLYPGQSWGWDGTDPRRASYPTDRNPGFHDGWTPNDKSWAEIFLKLFPRQWGWRTSF